jgi:XRE family transcriptional regulator of biofilm formation
MKDILDLKRLGHQTRFLRLGKGWTLSDLAERSGVSKAYISDLENGAAGKPNIQYVYSISRALDTTLDRLLDDVASTNPAEDASTQELPPGLAELRDEQKLSDEDVERLASVQFRGNRPRDIDGWRYLLKTLEMLGQHKRKS